MKNLILTLLFLSFFSSSAQENNVPDRILESIKKDVWIPFMESYAELDSDKLKSIHTKDIVRVLLDQNKVQSGESYLEEFGGFLNRVKANEGKLGIAFAIVSTAINNSEDLAFQTGYYEFSSKNKDDQNLVVRGYGHFSVGLRKTEGSWRLFLDSDKRITLTLEEFENQSPVYRLNR